MIRPRPIVSLPAVVAGQRDMFPAEWCDMARDLVRRVRFGQCPFEIADVPQDDRPDQQFRPEARQDRFSNRRPSWL